MPMRRRCASLYQPTVVRLIRENTSLFSMRYADQINIAGKIRNLSSGRHMTRVLTPSRSILNVRQFSSGTKHLNMRFVQFVAAEGGPQRLGVQLSKQGDIIDISGVDHSIPNKLVQFLRAGPGLMERTKRIVAEGKSVMPYADVRILPPLTAPDKVVCVGLNYRGHCEEQNLPHPKEPMFFSKFSSCITGPYDDIKYPTITKQLDWEVELAVVIGKEARDVKPTKAMEHVFGFTVAQDLSARDWQKSRNNGQFLLGKAMDQFCPLGPVVVTKEAIPDPYDLGIRCKVNGTVKQEGNTSELIHRIDHIISFLSHICTLLPGDVILTGTPAGVGMHRKPPEFLKVGDVLESEIDGIGAMKNTFVS
ncbi:oxaloacetate tautomerase FAHD2A, mitochondrial [Anabrus simplex]|uniref:oxaloacetate tautomerase FAHD2A, mitochondrial n=1 Tax=Anabrus simplex TaxID=316456 RepID=UPI0034DD840D